MLFPTDEHIVTAHCNADAVRHSVVDGRDHALIIDECGPAEAVISVWPVWRGRYRNWMIRPVNQVRAGCMAPVYVAPIGAHRDCTGKRRGIFLSRRLFRWDRSSNSSAEDSGTTDGTGRRQTLNGPGEPLIPLIRSFFCLPAG